METTVSVRMTRELYERLETAAKADKRKVGEMARLIIEESMPSVERRVAARESDRPQ